jgi:dihydrofolate reductase
VPNLIYSMGVSLDGYIAGPGDDINWTVPDDELFSFHTERMREVGAHLMGRRLYETMLVWETYEEDNPSASELMVEFERIWKPIPKFVFSTTLEAVQGNATLVRDDLAATVAKLKQQPGKDLSVGGAGLAGACARLNLIDEYQLFVYPVVLGGGTPYFPALEQRLDLELDETRTFGSQVVYLRYLAS